VFFVFHPEESYVATDGGMNDYIHSVDIKLFEATLQNRN
jgi:hypothetical protein